MLFDTAGLFCVGTIIQSLQSYIECHFASVLFSNVEFYEYNAGLLYIYIYSWKFLFLENRKLIMNRRMIAALNTMI